MIILLAPVVLLEDRWPMMTNPIPTHVALQRQERHKMTGELGRRPMNYKMT